MDNEGKITHGQAAFLSYASAAGNIVFTFTFATSIIGRAFWVAVLIGALMNIPFALWILYLGKSQQGGTIFDILETGLGKVVCKIIIVMYLLLNIAIAVCMLNMFSGMIKLYFLQFTPTFAIMLFIVLICTIFANSGIQNFARLVEILGLLFTVNYFFGFFLSFFKTFKMEYVVPVFDTSSIQFAKGIMISAGTCGESLMFLMIFKKSDRKADEKNEKLNKIDFSSDQKNIINSTSSFHIKEAYKTLRTNITFSLPVQGCKTIAVTSSLASEGKSINCLNLAITFAETGSKVLLVDCDLRRPNVARLLDKSATPGLSNVLVNLSDLNTVMQKTDYENLDVIYSGDIPPNPTELLSSPKMEEILHTLAEQYDYIFLDTPPVNLIADTTILSKYVSGLVVIVRQNKSVKDALLDTVSQLKFAEAKILGFVLNGAPVVAGGKYNKYSKYKGYYRYQEEYSVKNDNSKTE